MVEPERPVFGAGDEHAHFLRHLKDPRKPCPTRRPVAHAAWSAENLEVAA